MRAGRVELGKTPIRFDLQRAREASSRYNILASTLTPQLVKQRWTIPDICNGPLLDGDLDALVVFLHRGLIYRDDTLDEQDVSKMLGDWVKPKDKGGKGGGLVDFHEPIVQALMDCGVVKPKTVEPLADQAPDEEDDAPARPTVFPRAVAD